MKRITSLSITLAVLLATLAVATTVLATSRLPIGGHAWGGVDQLWVRDGSNCVIAAPVPSQLEVTYADLRTRCDYTGPAESNYDRFVAQVERSAAQGANAAVYVPELVPQTPPGESGVPIEEGEELELYLESALTATQQSGLVMVYGPSTVLLKTDPDQRWGELWALDLARITRLASLMPDGSQWIIRAFNIEVACGADETCFRGAVTEYVSAIHAGNPNIGAHVHLKLPPDDVDAFLMRSSWVPGTGAVSVYAGLGPNSTGEELIAVLGD